MKTFQAQMIKVKERSFPVVLLYAKKAYFQYNFYGNGVQYQHNSALAEAQFGVYC